VARGSIALSALPGSELDVASSLLKFRARTFKPLIQQQRWWNAFMFGAHRRWFIVACVLLAATSGLMDAVYSRNDEPIAIVAASVCVNLSKLAFVAYMGAHWLDRRLAREALCGFESVYCLANFFVYNVAALWLAAPVGLNVLSYATGVVGDGMAFLIVVASDAMPRALVSRRVLQMLYGVVALLSAAAWMRAGILISSPSDGVDGEVCIIICMPLLRVQASAAFNLSVFLLRFCASLSVWPRAAVILRTRLYLE
jgi:hypothetical protein